MSEEETHRSLAVAAAHQAAIATAELLRFSREGAASDLGAMTFDDDAVMKLCDAAKLAMEIELAREQDEGEREALGQAHAALTRLIEGWA